MKKLLLAFTLTLIGGSMLASAQTVEVKIKNQYIKGTEFFFDVYLEKTAGDTILMGYADIVIDNSILNNGGFVTPALNYVTGTNAFKNANGDLLTSTYNSLIATTITGAPNANRIIINLNLAGFTEATPGDALAKLAFIAGSDTSQRLGTFRITGLTGGSNANAFYPNANFSTSGAGIKVKVYKIATFGAYTQTRLTESVVSTASVLQTAPTSGQLAGIAVTKDGAGSTPTSLKIDWTGVAAANGDSLLIIARARTGGAAANDSTPANSLRYFANNDWSARADANRIGQTAWYVVYRGTSTNGTVTISNISNSDEYIIRAIPYAGLGGYNSAYASKADLNSNNATIQIITTPTATEPTIQIAGITLTTNQSNPNTSIGFQIDTTGITAGDSVIVLAKATTAFDTTADRPVDGNFYASNLNYSSAATIGAARIVYRGLVSASAGLQNVTNLTADTRYYFEAVVYRGTSGALSQNYRVNSPQQPAAANRYTTPVAVDPAVASNQSRDLVLTSSTFGSIQISWTNGAAGSGSIVIARETSATNASPTQGAHYSTANSDVAVAPTIGVNNFIVYSGTGTSVTVSGLKPNQRYHFTTVRYVGNTANAGNLNYIQDGGGSNWGRGNENTYINVTARASFETMDTLLKDATNLVPLAQPFNSAAYGSYAGAESVGSIPNGVVDWVLLELRRTTTGSLVNAGPASVPGSGATLIGRRAAFLKFDGSIVGTNGTDTALQFNIADEGQYFLVVYHRNHLPIMTSTANALGLSLFVTGGAATADLRVSANVAGTAGTEFLVDGGVAKMWSGNVDPSDYVIDGDDRAAAWTNRNTEDAYNIADVDLDRNVSARDNSFIWNNRTKAAYVRIAQD